MTTPRATDLIVEDYGSAETLDRTVQTLGPAAIVEGSETARSIRVRVFGDPGYIKFAINHQGYGKVVGEEPVA